MQEKIEADLKQAMLSGDKTTAEALRLIKSVLQNEMIASGSRAEGLSDDKVTSILQRETKKRHEAAELYKNAGESERAAKEESEAALIEKYLPEKISDEEIAKAVEEQIAALDAQSLADMGKVISAVRTQLGVAADAGVIAKIAKDKLA